MGRKKQNRVDRWQDEFGVVYRIGKARAGDRREHFNAHRTKNKNSVAGPPKRPREIYPQ